MNIDDVKIFFELLKDDNYCLLYNGNFIDTITAKIINISRINLAQRGEIIPIQNRFSFLTTELFQNIIRHGGHKEQGENDERLPGFFMTQNRNKQYNIIAGNLIDNDKVEQLKLQFDELNSLNNHQLKDLYKKVITQGELSAKGGAGVGLIDMARKSGHKLEYQFLKHSDTQSMFYNLVIMDSDSKNIKSEEINIGIDLGIHLHKIMVDRNILMVQKSDFSTDSVSPMLKIIEKNISLNEGDSNLVAQVYNVLVELIKNMHHHGLKYRNRKEGIFLISKKDNSYRICAGNYIDKRKVRGFKRFMDRVATMNQDELKDFYMHRLMHTDKLNFEDSGKGFLDIGGLLSERFTSKFYDVDAEASFFSISAKI
ncbi:MAG: hypothetical protein JEZ09_10085 [Salinivirgaceae bacterium]|nr:hypothetical protein [Salinivirgaceae bacterium]